MLETVMQKIYLVAGLVLLALALRSFAHPWLRKAGIFALLGASYAGAFFLFRHPLAGVAAVLAWFFLPWVELLTRIRGLRLPLEKKLEHMAPPSQQRFPALESMTSDIEAEGFEYVDDAGWEWDRLAQFFRIFYNPQQRLLTLVCLNEQNQMGFVHLAISCRDRQGRTWKTWDYPFSYSLQSSPELCLNQVEPGGSFAELREAHLEFLELNGVGLEELVEEELEQVHHIMEQEVRGQIDHNLLRGIIRESGGGTFRYSWRGLFFLWTQVLKDMVKLF